MRRHSSLIMIFAVSGALLTGPVWAQGAGKGKTPASPSEELAQKAVGLAKEEKYEDALELFREAYRLDHSARWLYNMGVLHDRMAQCDDAAFFYRASMWGKGVLPQDRDAVDNRLGVLEDECHFKKRHATPADRHARAARYIAVRLCFLANSILEGIATPAEKKAIEQCGEKKP